MSNQKSNPKNNKRDDENKNTVKKTVMFIILIIIIILSLITSCSCTSGFFGRIGDIFRNDGNVDIDDSTKQRVKVKNQDLKFDKTELEISLSDTKAKLSFSYENINPKEFTCTTSDASIATCYVSDGYVVINPKKAGKVTVTLSTDTNGKTYQAIADVTIVDDIKRQIKLSSKSGTINMAYAKTKSITYSLIGLDGDVTVVLSNPDVADVALENGVLKITAKKKGKTTITLSLNYDGKEYSVVYNLNVINDKNSNVGKPGANKPNKPSKPEDGDNMGEGGDNPGTPSDPENPDNPDIPVEPVLDNNTKLKKLDLSWIFYDFDPETREYGVKIASWRKTIKIDAVPQSDKAKVVSYSLNGVLYTGEQLKEKLPLQEGDNILVVTVQAEDGSLGSYRVVINKPKSNNSLLKDLSSTDADGNEIKLDFNKNTLYYEINVPNSTKTINFDAIPRSKKATLEYTFNNNTVTSLNNLYLRVGVNVLEIKVTSEDKRSVTTYKVVINRAPEEGAVDRRSELASLTDTLGKVDFNPYETNYNIAVGSDTEKIGFTAVPASPNATVVYKFNGVETTDISDLALNTGDNILEIEVTAPDGVTKTTYTVHINKANEDNSNVLTNIEILDNKGVLNPEFDENQLSYTVDVDENTSEIGFKVETTATKVTYTYNGHIISAGDISNLPLNMGENKLQITTGDRTYTIVINRKSNKSSDVSLKDVTVDGESIIGSFEKIVDKDTNSVKLEATPNDDKASVKYYFNGQEVTNGVIEPLTSGANIVTVVVTAEDGTEKSYEVVINKEAEKDENGKSTDASLKEFLVNGENTLGTNEVELGSNEDITSIVVTPNDKNANITEIKYEYNGTSYTVGDLDTLKNELNKKLNPGESATVTVEVTAEDGKTKREYDITVKKAEKPVIKEDTVLTDLVVKDNKAEIQPNFQSDVMSYTINVNDNENSITLLPTSNGGTIEYRFKNDDGTLTEFKPLQGGEIPVDLTNGDKYVIIRVSDADGDSNEYQVKVHKTVRTIEVTSKSESCYIEDQECILEYVVKEDGMVVSNYDTANLVVSGLPEGVKYEHIEYGKIKLIPDGKLISADTDVTVNLGIKDYNDNLTNATVKFTTRDHKIWSDKGTYDLPYLDDKKDRTIILNTDPYLLTGNVSWTVDSTGKILTIETEDRRKVVVEANGPIKIEYIGSKVGNNSLPIKITATGTGEAYLNVSGSAYGKEINGPTIKINVKRGYLVTLIADNDTTDKLVGLFNEMTSIYEFMLTVDNPNVDLSMYPKPYLITDDECHYYEFKQYIVMGETKTYTGEEVIKYEDLNDNLTLVADYDMSTKQVLETQSRTVMVTDIPLFYNKESATNYGEDKAKMIYPGASGKYTIEVNNKGTQDMKITGMFIEENTICIDGGCLNMGYIIRDEAGTYYMGDGTTLDGTKTTPTYSILNKNATSSSIKDGEYFYKNEIKLNEAEYLLIPALETREITIHWKWVDAGTHEGDIIDTKIGNKAAELGNIDLMYQVSIGINYDVILDKCSEASVESGN